MAPRFTPLPSVRTPRSSFDSCLPDVARRGWAFWCLLLVLLTGAAGRLSAVRVADCDAPVQSRKRGVGVNSMSAADFTVLAPGVSWYYNWTVAPLATKPPSLPIEYVPMVWNGSAGSRETLSSYLGAGNRPWRVLALNEPNLTTQANMTPQQCATTFGQVLSIANAYGIPVVAPQMAIGTAANQSVTAFDPIQNKTVTYTYQQPFLDAFLYYCGSTPPAGLSTHSYGGYGEITWITGTMHTAYPNEKVWLTEFADWGVQNDADVVSMLIQSVDYCERTPWIEGYAWFMSRITGDPHNSLLASASGVLTPVGQAYVQMPVHDADLYYRLPGRLQAERYVTLNNVSIAATGDADGLADMVTGAAGGSTDYNVQVNAAGTYRVDLRATGAGTVSFYRGSELLGSANVAGGGAWSTVSTNLPLTAGAQTLHVVFSAKSQRLNWLEFSAQTNLPPAPTGLVADAGNGQVRLSWNAVPGATGYRVSRTGAGGATPITVATPTTPGFTDTGLANGTAYQYTVSAVNGVGVGAPSNQVSATPTATTTNLPVVTVTATVPQVTAGTGGEGDFKLVRSGDTSTALTVTYQVSGSAVNGGDYASLSGTKTLGVKRASTTIRVKPVGQGAGPGVPRTVILSVSPGSNYTVGTPAAATVTIVGR